MNFFLAGLSADLNQERGFQASPGLKQVIAKHVDQNSDGVIDIHEL